MNRRKIQVFGVDKKNCFFLVILFFSLSNHFEACSPNCSTNINFFDPNAYDPSEYDDDQVDLKKSVIDINNFSNYENLDENKNKEENNKNSNKNDNGNLVNALLTKNEEKKNKDENLGVFKLIFEKEDNSSRYFLPIKGCNFNQGVKVSLEEKGEKFVDEFVISTVVNEGMEKGIIIDFLNSPYLDYDGICIIELALENNNSNFYYKTGSVKLNYEGNNIEVPICPIYSITFVNGTINSIGAICKCFKDLQDISFERCIIDGEECVSEIFNKGFFHSLESALNEDLEKISLEKVILNNSDEMTKGEYSLTITKEDCKQLQKKTFIDIIKEKNFMGKGNSTNSDKIKNEIINGTKEEDILKESKNLGDNKKIDNPSELENKLKDEKVFYTIFLEVQADENKILQIHNKNWMLPSKEKEGYTDKVSVYLKKIGKDIYEDVTSLVEKGALKIPKKGSYKVKIQLHDLNYGNIVFKLQAINHIFVEMFKDCTGLKSVKIVSHYKEEGVLSSENIIDYSNYFFNISSMFSGCTNLKKIDFTEFDTRSVSKYHNLLKGCSKLNEIFMQSPFCYSVRDLNMVFGENIDHENFYFELGTFIKKNDNELIAVASFLDEKIENFKESYDLESLESYGFGTLSRLYNCVTLWSEIEKRNLNAFELIYKFLELDKNEKKEFCVMSCAFRINEYIPKLGKFFNEQYKKEIENILIEKVKKCTDLVKTEFKNLENKKENTENPGLGAFSSDLKMENMLFDFMRYGVARIQKGFFFNKFEIFEKGGNLGIDAGGPTRDFLGRVIGTLVNNFNLLIPEDDTILGRRYYPNSCFLEKKGFYLMVFFFITLFYALNNDVSSGFSAPTCFYNMIFKLPVRLEDIDLLTSSFCKNNKWSNTNRIFFYVDKKLVDVLDVKVDDLLKLLEEFYEKDSVNKDIEELKKDVEVKSFINDVKSLQSSSCTLDIEELCKKYPKDQNKDQNKQDTPDKYIKISKFSKEAYKNEKLKCLKLLMVSSISYAKAFRVASELVCPGFLDSMKKTYKKDAPYILKAMIEKKINFKLEDLLNNLVFCHGDLAIFPIKNEVFRSSADIFARSMNKEDPEDYKEEIRILKEFIDVIKKTFKIAEENEINEKTALENFNYNVLGAASPTIEYADMETQNNYGIKINGVGIKYDWNILTKFFKKTSSPETWTLLFKSHTCGRYFEVILDKKENEFAILPIGDAEIQDLTKTYISYNNSNEVGDTKQFSSKEDKKDFLAKKIFEQFLKKKIIGMSDA